MTDKDLLRETSCLWEITNLPTSWEWHSLHLVQTNRPVSELRINLKLHNQRYCRLNSPVAFSSRELLENGVIPQICSYCSIIFAWLFTINHSVCTGSSSVFQRTSRVQSNTTSDWTNAPPPFLVLFGLLPAFLLHVPFALTLISPFFLRLYPCCVPMWWSVLLWPDWVGFELKRANRENMCFNSNQPSLGINNSFS